MYGTVFEVGFVSGSSYLDNTGINAIARSAFRPVLINVQVTFKRGKRGAVLGKDGARSAESFVHAFTSGAAASGVRGEAPT